jgi:hypothetical protein
MASIAATALLVLDLGVAVARAGTAPDVAALSPPVAHGTVAIRGEPRDGAVVRAAGVVWSVPPLPAGSTLLSFVIATYWRSCDAHGCRVAADATSTPFAARRYVVGHADVGRHLRVIQTATEVVETPGTGFDFRVLSTSQIATQHHVVFPFAYVPDTPFTEFVNGTPETRTASTEEIFQVDPPHFDASRGAATMMYRIDGGAWTAVPHSHLIDTGTLGVGDHHLHVRVANGAGAGTIHHAWTVIPMPAPQACIHRAHRACWYPPHLDSTNHPMRWDWQIGLNAPRQRTGARSVDLYDVDGFLTTAAQIRAIHRTWEAATLAHPRTICYLDLAWEDYRPDGSPTSQGGAWPARTLGNVYYGYPQERWVDLRQLSALKPMLEARIAMCARKDFDAIELDDIDSFEPASTSGFNLAPGDAQNFLRWAFNEVHRQGMTALWKNTGILSSWGHDYTDGAVVEECYTYSECFASQLVGQSNVGITCTVLAGPTPCGWDDFTTDTTAQQPTGKWVGEAEYGADHYVCDPGRSCPNPRRFTTYCSTVYDQSYGYAAVKFSVNLDGSVFYPCPTGT